MSCLFHITVFSPRFLILSLPTSHRCNPPESQFRTHLLTISSTFLLTGASGRESPSILSPETPTYGNLESCIWMSSQDNSDLQRPWGSGISKLLAPGAKGFKWQKHTNRDLTIRDQSQYFNSLYISNHLLAMCIKTKVFLVRKLQLSSLYTLVK